MCIPGNSEGPKWLELLGSSCSPYPHGGTWGPLLAQAGGWSDVGKMLSLLFSAAIISFFLLHWVVATFLLYSGALPELCLYDCLWVVLKLLFLLGDEC